MTSLLNQPWSLSQLHSLNREQWLSVVTRFALPSVMALTVLGIAWQLAQLTWMLAEPKPSSQPRSVTAPRLAESSTNNTINAQSIADAHLFGMPAPVSEADPNNLPQTQMSLVLAGTIALSNPEAGYAIVGDTAINAKFYRAGSLINGAVRLHSVYTDRVIIDRAGVLETLVLPHGPGLGVTTPMARKPTPGAQLSENIRRMAANNPAALTQLLRVQPVFANGAQKGYRVYPGRDRAQFVRLGLQPGDLITAINGTSLDDPNINNDILGLLSSSSSVNASIERNGAVMQLNLDVSQITLPEENNPNVGAESSDAIAPSPAVRGMRQPPMPNQAMPSAQ